MTRIMQRMTDPTGSDRRATAWLVRPATDDDVEAIRHVAETAWQATYAGQLRDETIAAFYETAYNSDTVAWRVRNDLFLVAEDPDGIAAYADATIEADRVHLAAIYALPDRAGRGAGSALLDAIAKHAPDRPIDAWVLDGNR